MVLGVVLFPGVGCGGFGGLAMRDCLCLLVD